MANLDVLLANCPYYHGNINRNEAVTRLKNRNNGSFLLRKSPNRHDGSFVISVINDVKVIHYSIEPVSGLNNAYRINNGSVHESPIAVVEHYIHSKSGLKCHLMFPVLNQEIQQMNPSLLLPSYITIDKDDENNNEVQRPTIRSAAWFHGSISRDEDTKRLMTTYRQSKKNGTFLVREKEDQKFVLSAISDGNIHRYMVLRTTEDKLYIDGKENDHFASLPDLIDHHINYPPHVTGIKCQLTRACSHPSNSKPIIPSKSQPALPARNASTVAQEIAKLAPDNLLDLNWSKSKSRHNSTATNTVEKEKTVNKQEEIIKKRFDKSFRKKSKPSETIGFFSPYQNTSTSQPTLELPKEIYLPKEDISIYEQLGSGQFGAVHLGRCMIHGKGVPCAVKFLNGKDADVNKSEVIVEAKIMQRLDHPHIVRLLGICQTDDLTIVMELAPLGTLHSWLKQQPHLPISQLLLILKQVCSGMSYLEQQKIVHRDLAARNVLLVSENFAKVSDFGMSRLLQESENYYKSTNPGMWPLRWYAPECLLFYKFTPKSDVWSFGITMWETISYGKKPYRNMTGREIIEFLENENRLEMPLGCSDELYDMMLTCWCYNPDDRPSFENLLPEITTLYEVSVLPPLFVSSP